MTASSNAGAKGTVNPHPSLDRAYTPGATESSAHDWSRSTTGGLRPCGRNFVDQWGRVCLLRGANLSGSSKTPSNHDPATFPGAHRTVTFVGKPFPLEKALEHLARLRRWGLTLVRFMVTWEALEHAGPGKYDTEYLSYIKSVLSLLPEYGMTAFVSMHQDVWSRYSGGSGAPAWTLELAGFDLEALEQTGAAFLGGIRQPGEMVGERGAWPAGYQKLAASTMNTLFWAGETFAPKLLIERKDGEKVNVQTFLQDALLDCFEWLVKGLEGVESVMGYEMMNEPHRGYISLHSMHEFNYKTDLHIYDIPSALQSFSLGAGYPTRIQHWIRGFPLTRRDRINLRNVDRRKVWRDDGPTGGDCPWRIHGVWKWDKRKGKPVALKENYFDRMPGDDRKVDWHTDFFYPFVTRWAERVHRCGGHDKIIFAEGIPNEYCPGSWTPDLQPENMVYAPHWYDLAALFAYEFGRMSLHLPSIKADMPMWRWFCWGQPSVRANYESQLRSVTEEAYKSLGERPVLIGETGTPMNLNKGEAFVTGDFVWHERMMDAVICGLERNLIGFTLWNYCPFNTDSHGDFWNGENFSWFSEQCLSSLALRDLDQKNEELDQGARLLSVIVRPYAAKVAGIPLRTEYEVNTGCWEFEWANRKGASGGSELTASPEVARPPLELSTPLVARETEIFLPLLITKGRKILVDYSSSSSSGLSAARCAWTYDADRQTFFVTTEDETPGAVHRVRLTFDPPLKRRFPWPFVETTMLWGGVLSLLSVIAWLLARWRQHQALLATMYRSLAQIT